MVDETDVSALHRALVISLGPERADPASLEAGRLTGDYLLANRIPQKAQSLLRVLPRWLAARVLLTAVAKHAWTFAGSGRFSYTFSPRPVLRIEGSPICRQLRTADPACAYFAATFERLFRRILGDDVRVTETECESSGAAACVFRVEW
jgi:divinyl protochlorophyllide a 8-vinyl-reductase